MTITNADSSVSENNTDTYLTSNNNNTAEVIQTQQTPDDNNSAPPSNAGEKTDDKKSLLNVVEDAIKKTNGDPSNPTKEGEQSKNPLDPNAPKDKDQVGKENSEEDTRFDKHPRFQKLLTENKTLKSQNLEFKPLASEFQKVTAYMDSNGLNHQEVARGFEIMAAMKNEPLKALQMLEPYFRGLEQFSGDILPQDLQQKVDEGYIDRAHAQELARTRNLAAHVQEQNRLAKQAQEENVRTEISNLRLTQLQGVVSNWESGMKSRDPDYDKKRDSIQSEVRLALGNRNDISNEELSQVCQQAHQIVTSRFANALGRRPEIRPMNTSLSSATRGVVPQPKSVREALDFALLNGDTT